MQGFTGGGCMAPGVVMLCTCLAWPRRVARGFIPRVFVNAGHKAPRYTA